MEATDVQPGFDADDWTQGADGLFAAIRSLEEVAKPLVVYFYTDWCGYCRQFERELLGTLEVKSYLGEVLAVRINPESGPKEKEIASYYGVEGYPAFFVHGASSKTLARVERMTVEGGEPRLLTPPAFVDTMRQAAAQ